MYKRTIVFILICYPFISSAQVGQTKLPADSTSSSLSVSATGYYYFFQGSENNSLTLIGYLDYKSLHLEPRYNYEGQNTGSIFAGWKFEAEGKVSLAVTPMLGIVFGSLQGFAPGLELELSYKDFDFYTENEYVFDHRGNEYNFFIPGPNSDTVRLKNSEPVSLPSAPGSTKPVWIFKEVYLLNIHSGN